MHDDRNSPNATAARAALVEREWTRFRPSPWLRNPHLQTVWGPLVRRSKPLPFRVERLETPDDDWVTLQHLAGAPHRPRALLVHGLEGSSRSHYLQGTAKALNGQGFEIVVLELRSCDGKLNRAPRLYHSGATDDLDLVIRALVAREPDRALFLTGFSLGGNLVLKWLGETGDRVPGAILAAAAVCPPFDLTVSGPGLDRVLGGFYSRWFLRQLVPKAIAKARQYPDLLDEAALRSCRTFEAFDTHGTAALHGFRDAWDYWSKVSCGRFLGGIRRPTLLLAAGDDPFNPGSTLPWEAVAGSPSLEARFTRRGGHIGFVYGANPLRPRYWYEGQIESFFSERA